VAAGLFVRTFASLANLHLGFDSDRVLIVNVNTLPIQTTSADRLAIYERLRQAIGGVPGVAAAAVSIVAPVSRMTWNTRIAVSDSVDLPERQRQANYNAITTGWLAAYGTRLVAGRDVTERDVPGAPRVALVNEAFARKFLNGASPIGHIIRNLGF